MAKKNTTPITIYCDDDEIVLPEYEQLTPMTDDLKLEDEEAYTRCYTPEHRGTPNIYRTSISSLPQSSTGSEDEQDYTPTKSRAYGRGISSFSSRYSHGLTPRSARCARVRVSPRPRTRERQEERDRVEQPLVLLHVTLLPIVLPWSQETVKRALPNSVMENLNLLRDKATSHVMQRGVLIPHPQDDLDMLKERLLEALELEVPRPKKQRDCSWRLSDGFESGTESDRTVDSGVDLEADKLDESGIIDEYKSYSLKRFEIKVFAANGLMQESSWAASWNEMEKVDVEIVPLIPQEVRQHLDTLREEHEASLHKQEQERKLEELARREEDLAEAERRHRALELDAQRRMGLERELLEMRQSQSHEPTETKIESPSKTKNVSTISTYPLPPAYRPKDIPLDILLRNYLYLLVQDRRNVVIMFLSITVMFLGLQMTSRAPALPTQIEVYKVLDTTSDVGLLHDQDTLLNASQSVVLDDVIMEAQLSPTRDITIEEATPSDVAEAVSTQESFLEGLVGMDEKMEMEFL